MDQNLTPKEKITCLTKEINEHDYLYYFLGKPKISDENYDKLYYELVTLETKYPEYILKDSPTQRIGYPQRNDDDIIFHLKKMYSIGNVYDLEGLYNWVKSKQFTKRTYLTAEVKLDGWALALKYNHGKLVSAALRGDGTHGRDVTYAAMQIYNIPKVSEDIREYEIYGEVVMPQEVFTEINVMRSAHGAIEYATPRSAVSGLFNSKNLPALFHLCFIAYGASFVSDYRYHEDMISDLETKYDFNIPNYVMTNHQDLQPIVDFYDRYNNSRSDDNYEWMDDLPADGIVIKVNNVTLQENIGYTVKHPKFMVAWKFTDDNKSTIIRDIIYQVGRTGILTPIALVDPVMINGVRITSINLYNESNIITNKYFIRTIVKVVRKGGVGPQIIGVKSRTHDTKIYRPIRTCPSCKHELSVSKGGVKRCTNTQCPGIMLSRFVHFTSRYGMSIGKLGPDRLKVLIDFGMVNLYELYDYDEETYISLFGQNIGSDIYQNIQASRSRLTFLNILKSVGIPGLRTVTLQTLVNEVCKADNPLDAYLTITKDVLELKKIAKTPGDLSAILWYNMNYLDELKNLYEYSTVYNSE